MHGARYRNFGKYSDVMTSASLRAVHYACAQFLVSQFQGQRYDVQEATKHKLQVPPCINPTAVCLVPPHDLLPTCLAYLLRNG